MEYKVLNNFSYMLENKKVTFKKNQIINLENEVIVTECAKKKLIEFVSIMDTNDDGIDFEEFGGDDDAGSVESVELLSLKELKKFKLKSDVIEYGHSIGLDELNDNFNRDEIESMIIEYAQNLEEQNADI